MLSMIHPLTPNPLAAPSLHCCMLIDAVNKVCGGAGEWPYQRCILSFYLYSIQPLKVSIHIVADVQVTALVGDGLKVLCENFILKGTIP
jgi:hypothetical protein